MEQEKRDEALSKPIESNIGLSLMKKMGFKEGTSLGKNASGGITEPISFKLKADREGLGSDEVKKRKAEETAERFRNRYKLLSDINEDSFIKLKRIQMQLRKMRHLFAKAQRVCFELDSNKVFFICFMSVKDNHSYF